LAKLFKEAMTGNDELIHIMTDMTGPYNKVVMVSKYENLTAYEQSWEKYKQDSEAMKKMTEMMKGYHEMYQTGSREIYQVGDGQDPIESFELLITFHFLSHMMITTHYI
jgi:hypothetical protein